MSEKFRQSLYVRQLRARLIKDGFSEDEADTILDDLRKEFAAIPDDVEQRRLVSEKISWLIARKRLGEGANPRDLEKFAKRYEEYILVIPKSLLGLAVTGIAIEAYRETTKGLSAISTELFSQPTPAASAPIPPSASAPIPPRVQPSTARLGTPPPIPPFVWPVEPIESRFTGRGIFILTRFPPPAFVEAPAPGEVFYVRAYHNNDGRHVFSIVIQHSDELLTNCRGYGDLLVGKGTVVSPKQRIAQLASDQLYFLVMLNQTLPTRLHRSPQSASAKSHFREVTTLPKAVYPLPYLPPFNGKAVTGLPANAAEDLICNLGEMGDPFDPLYRPRH
jgi:murein DD-endopeptidase MepM/ murein hydrolase activator NlpD